MTFDTRQFCMEARIDAQTLAIWLGEEWLSPRGEEDRLLFSEADVARVQLIRDLMDDLGVNAEGVGLVLRLVDQVHGLRSALADIVAAAANR
jgi:chaperone modulatory protein CbpM